MEPEMEDSLPIVGLRPMVEFNLNIVIDQNLVLWFEFLLGCIFIFLFLKFVLALAPSTLFDLLWFLSKLIIFV